MKFRKFAAAAAAVAVLGAAAPVMGLTNPLGVTASAAEMKLLTTDNVFDKYDSVMYLGEGYYVMYNGYNAGAEIVYCGTDVIDSWRKTGKLEVKTVSCGTDISGMTFKSGTINKNGGIVKLVSTAQNEDGMSIGICHVFTLDKAKNEFTEAYSYQMPSIWSNASSRNDGYSFVEDKKDWQTKEYTYSVYDTKGNRTQKTVSPKNYDGAEQFESDLVSFVECYGEGKYVGFACVADYATEKSLTISESFEAQTFLYEISGINKDGSLTPLTEVRSYGNEIIPALFGGENFVAWKNYEDGCYYVMTLDDNKTYKLESNDKFNYIAEVIGKKVVVEKRGIGMPDGGYPRMVFDLETGKMLAEDERSMTSNDGGKIFTSKAKGYDGEWRYFDENLKLLGSFPDAGSFIEGNQYAPVVQDGKGWLVDRNMNQVSEKIDAVGCTTLGKDLFRFKTSESGDYVLVTSSESGAVDVPTTPETPEKPVKKVEFKNEDANAVVTANEGAVPEGAEFAVKPLADENTETRSFFDLSFTKDGESVQPKGEVAVKLPVPEALKGKDINVYRVETDGKYTKLKAKTEGDFVTFTTSHFSKYLLTSDTIADAVPENPDTGVIFGFAAIAISGAAVLVSRKKHR